MSMLNIEEIRIPLTEEMLRTDRERAKESWVIDKKLNEEERAKSGGVSVSFLMLG